VTAVVEVRGLVAGHGGVPAVRGLDLVVDAGEVVALVGPNGAGKSTTLETIAGVLPAIAGDVHVLGHPVKGHDAPAVARRGLVLVPEDRGIFHRLSVADNLRLRQRRGSGVELDEVLDHFPALADLRGRAAGLLSGGEQQMLALAGALLAAPRVLLIDEMSMGLAPVLVERLLPLVRSVAEVRNIGVLLVEQHVHAALEVADRAYVLVHGELGLEGRAEDLIRDHALLEQAYLGAAS